MISLYTQQDTKPRWIWLYSWRLWSVLRAIPAHWRLHRVLMPHQSLHKPQHLGRNLGIILILLLFTFSFPIPFLLLHYFALILVWRVASAIAEQHELGTRDLIAITPSIGDFGLALEICRLCWDDIVEQASGFYRSLVSFLSVGILLLNGFSLIAGMVSLSALISGLFTFIMGVALIALWCYIEIRYGLLTAALIGMLAGSTGDRRNARAFALGGYVALHTFLFFLQVIFLGLVISAAGRSSVPIGALLGYGLGAWAVFSLVREALIFGLWQALRWRLNDDVPALKIMLQQD